MKRLDFLPIFAELTEEFPELVFWKHFDRGINGLGDIDCIISEEMLDDVSAAFVRKVFFRIPGAYAVFQCRYSLNVRTHFVVINGEFPSLFQFDISTMPVRFGRPWCHPCSLVDFSCINDDYIRVLKPGALSVVLLMLYGVNCKGVNSIKSHDMSDLLDGVFRERQVLFDFIEYVIDSKYKKILISIFDAISNNFWPSLLIRTLWFRLAIDACYFHLNRSPSDLIYKFIRRINGASHHHLRVSPFADPDVFCEKMHGRFHVLNKRIDVPCGHN